MCMKLRFIAAFLYLKTDLTIAITLLSQALKHTPTYALTYSPILKQHVWTWHIIKMQQTAMFYKTL